MEGTGFLGEHDEEVYRIERDDLYLVGTSEVALAGMHSGEVLDLGEEPRRYAGWSSCFRREAGSYGKDTRGLIRVHWFDKVEMFSFSRPEDTEAEHLRLLARPADGRVVVVGATREDREEALGSLRRVLLIGGPVALILAALAAYGVATAALRPVNAMREEAAEISRLGSGRRLPVPPGRDELAELGGTLNEMLERLEHRTGELERSRDQLSLLAQITSPSPNAIIMFGTTP